MLPVSTPRPGHNSFFQTLNSRQATCKKAIPRYEQSALPHAQQAARFFKSCLKYLQISGRDVISDDEEHSEPWGTKSVRKKRLAWAREGTERARSRMDDARNLPGIRSERGNRGLVRLAAVQDSTRPPPVGLPVNFYSPAWLENINDFALRDLQLKDVTAESIFEAFGSPTVEPERWERILKRARL